MTRLYRWMVLSALVCACVISCKRGEEGLGGKNLEGGHLKIGILPTRGILPLVIAQEKGYFAEQNVTVELIPFNSASEMDGAFQGKEVDGMFSDLVSSVLMRSMGVPLHVVTLIAGSSSGEGRVAIVASPGSAVFTADDLKGRDIAVAPNTIIDFVTDELLEEEGIASTAVNKIPVAKIHLRLSMLLEDKVAAATLPEPLITYAQKKGARVILDDRHDPRCYLVMAMHGDALRNRSGAIKRMLIAYNKAVIDINERPELYRAQLIEAAKVPEEIEEIVRVPRFAEWKVPTEDQYNRVVNWLISKELIQQGPNYGEVVEHRMMSELSQQQARRVSLAVAP